MVHYINIIPQNIIPIDNFTSSYSNNDNIIYSHTVLERLVDNISYNYTVYLTGGIVNRGYTNKDIDIWIKEKLSKLQKIELNYFFLDMIKYRIHILNADIDEEKYDNLFLYKIYENGKKIIY